MFCFRAGVALAATLALVASSPGQDWPQWRGPNRDGVIKVVAEPQEWPERLKLKWRVAAGEGQASPVLADSTVFLHARLGDREVVSALRLDKGEVIWQQDYSAPFTMNPAARQHGKGVKSTPVVSNGRLYTLGISETLSCWESKGGKLLWRKEASPEAASWRAYLPMVLGRPLLQKEFAPATFGTAMSPVVDHGLVIVHLGAAGLAAFDAETGDEKWSWKDDRPGYASPVVVELRGTRQVITMTETNIISVAATDGRLLWKVPYTTNFQQNIVTPVVYGQTIIFSGLNNGTMAIRPTQRGDEWVPEKVWENKEIPMYMSSPVLSGELLFGYCHRNKGQFFCAEARTGAIQWTSPGRQGDNAAIVSAGNALLLLKDNAELIVARRNRQSFQPVRRYTVADSPTWAHPVVLSDGILVKDTGTLALWGFE